MDAHTEGGGLAAAEGTSARADPRAAEADDAGDRSAEAEAMEVDAGAGGEAAGAEASAEAGEPAPKQEDDDDDDDPVTHTCDVYLNRLNDPPEFVGDMYLLQYPLRPDYRPYGRPVDSKGAQGKLAEDGMSLQKVELRRKAKHLRFTYQLNAGPNYEDMGTVVGQNNQQHVLTSTTVPNTYCNYAVGVIHQGKMVLCPIRAVNQLRPDFDHFDKARTQQVKGLDATAAAEGMEPEAGARGGESSAEDGPDQEGADGPAPVRMQIVSAAATPGAASSTAAPKEALQAEEPWSKLNYFGDKAAESNDVYEHHIVEPARLAAEMQASGTTDTENPKIQKLEFEQSHDEYLGVMCGQINSVARRREKQQKRAAEDVKDGLAAAVLMRLPVERQVETIVRQYGVLSYSKHLKRRLPPRTIRLFGADAKLLPLLKTCAVFCAGLWVLSSAKAGYDDMEQVARDMALFILHQKRGQMNEQAYRRWREAFRQIPRATCEEILKGVCDIRRNPEGQYFQLKHLPDDDFPRDFPRLVEEYNAWWPTRREEIIADIKKLSMNSDPNFAQSANARISKRLLGEVRRELSEGAIRIEELQKRIQRQNSQLEITEELLQQVLKDPELEAVRIHELWLLRSGGNPETDKFRSAMLQIFRQRDSASKEDILAMYQDIHKEKCKMSAYQIRTQLREIAEKESEDSEMYWIKGMLARRARPPA